MDVQEEVLKAAIKTFVELVIKRAANFLADHKQSAELVSKQLEGHMVKACNWSGQIQLYGMNSPHDTDKHSIPLSLHVEPRRFRTKEDVSQHINEVDLLASNKNYILLGEPGSGKTTTIKRLIRNLIVEPTEPDIDVFQYPIILRLRELKSTSSLYEVLAQIIGLVYSGEKKIVKVKPEAETGFEDYYTILKVGDELIEYAVPKYLNESRAVIFLDGMDEVNPLIKSQIESQIKDLALKLNYGKMIISMRAGEFTRNFEGFHVIELLPLSEDQIVRLVNIWGVDSRQFLKELYELPYKDLTDRPLYLIQLLVLYKYYGYIPPKPSHLYKKILKLLLEDWDYQNQVQRTSKYSKFLSDQKAEFLAELSYHLTYELKAKQFTEKELIDVYCEIHDSYDLPKGEARLVAHEIQTHTGIILAAGYDSYEFSHLSLQEYLCAEYLVKDQFAEHLDKYITDYPAPLAIAVELSSNSGNWFAGLILKDIFNSFNAGSMQSFLERILVERPSFNNSIPLGCSILKLYQHYYKNNDLCKYLDSLAKIEKVKESIQATLGWYYLDGKAEQIPGYFIFKKRAGLLNKYGFVIPNEGLLPKIFVREYMLFDNVMITCLGEKKTLYKLDKNDSILY